MAQTKHQAFKRRVHRQVAAACVAAFLAAGTVITATSNGTHATTTSTQAQTVQATPSTQSTANVAQTQPVTTSTS